MMSRWLVRSWRSVIVASASNVGMGRLVDAVDGEEGVKRRGTSAIDVQSMHSKNCETSEGKFLGYIVRTSPGA